MITASSFPEEFRWAMDFGGQTFVHRTVERSLLQHLAVRRIGRKRNVNFRRERNDSARGVFRHFLLHGDTHSAQIDTEFLRFDSHGRAHARSQSRSDEISRRKRFTFAFVVGRRVSRNL